MSPLEGPITAVLRVFDVVIGVALERSLKDNRMVERALYLFEKTRPKKPGDNGHGRHIFIFELLYWASLAVLVSLALRFAIGSEVHLRHTYLETHGSLPAFLKDLVFLVFFGVLLVRAAFSARLAEFMLWLTAFLVLGIIWSLLDIAISSVAPFGCRWLLVNSFQLALTLLGWLWVHRKPGHAPYMLTILAVGYIAIFCFDVMQMIEASGPNQTGTVWFSGSPPNRTL
jgi:hypothetical protein